MKLRISSHFAEAKEILKLMSADAALIEEIEGAATVCIQTLRDGGKILIAGNGGSAADVSTSPQNW